jgi:hypothetical protein
MNLRRRKKIGGGVFGCVNRSESMKSRSSDTFRNKRGTCVTRREFERADLAKKRVAFFDQTKKQSLDG